MHGVTDILIPRNVKTFFAYRSVLEHAFVNCYHHVSDSAFTGFKPSHMQVPSGITLKEQNKTA